MHFVYICMHLACICFTFCMQFAYILQAFFMPLHAYSMAECYPIVAQQLPAAVWPLRGCRPTCISYADCKYVADVFHNLFIAFVHVGFVCRALT